MTQSEDLERKESVSQEKAAQEAVDPGRKEYGDFEEPREDQRGWRTVDADVADNEGREGSRGKTISSPHEAGLIYLEQFCNFNFSSESPRECFRNTGQKIPLRNTQSRLLEVRPKPKFRLFVCLLVVRPPDDFIVKFE